jgi:hypothetical protein
VPRVDTEDHPRVERAPARHRPQFGESRVQDPIGIQPRPAAQFISQASGSPVPTLASASTAASVAASRAASAGASIGLGNGDVPVGAVDADEAGIVGVGASSPGLGAPRHAPRKAESPTALARHTSPCHVLPLISSPLARGRSFRRASERNSRQQKHKLIGQGFRYAYLPARKGCQTPPSACCATSVVRSRSCAGVEHSHRSSSPKP